MVHCEVQHLYQRPYSILWSLLSFKSGFINAAGFLAAGSYVSHVTGFGTQIGVSLGHHKMLFSAELLLIPVVFILGGVITSVILERDVAKELSPNYPKVQGLITFLLACVYFFGDHEALPDIALTLILCLICGLKNSLTTWATSGKIRTTHITGLSTDIGLNFTKIFQGTNSKFRYPEKTEVNGIRLLTLISFSAGSCISALSYQYLQHDIFAIPLCMSLGFLLISILHRQRLINKQGGSR